MKEIEFSHFHRKPGKYIVYKVNLKNRLLRLRESRPDMYNAEAYTDWLIEKQKSGYIPDKPYGYRVRERLKSAGSFTYQVHYEIVPRIAPAWINNDKLLKQDSETIQGYRDWAEYYYLKSKSYPSGYLRDVKNTLDSHFFSGVFTGFKEDRYLKDVMYSLGGKFPTKDGEKGGDSTLLELMRGLTSQDRWLDGGTGAGFVLQDALKLIIKKRKVVSIEDVPSVLGITYNRPNPAIVPDGLLFSSSAYPIRLSQQTMRKYEILDGRLFQNIPIQELMPRFKLITDFFGIYTYSSDPLAVINKYLNVMEQGGTLGIVYNNKDFVKVKDKIMPFYEWLESVTGNDLSVEYGKGWLSSPGAEKEVGEVAYMLIRNSSGGEIDLPKLTMIEYKDAQRVFRPSADTVNAF